MKKAKVKRPLYGGKELELRIRNSSVSVARSSCGFMLKFNDFLGRFSYKL